MVATQFFYNRGIIIPSIAYFQIVVHAAVVLLYLRMRRVGDIAFRGLYMMAWMSMMVHANISWEIQILHNNQQSSCDSDVQGGSRNSTF